MSGRILALATALLLSTHVHAQTNLNDPGTTPGVTSGPAAGSPASMRSPQAGPLETASAQGGTRAEPIRAQQSPPGHPQQQR
jgi:hypothetical protein